MQPFLEHSVEEWREVIEVNLTGSFLMAREVAKVMIAPNVGLDHQRQLGLRARGDAAVPRDLLLRREGRRRGPDEGTRGRAREQQRAGQLDRPGLLPVADVRGHVQRGRVRRGPSPRRAPPAYGAAVAPRRARTCAGPCATSRATSRPSSPATCWSSTAAGAPSRGTSVSHRCFPTHRTSRRVPDVCDRRALSRSHAEVREAERRGQAVDAGRRHAFHRAGSRRTRRSRAAGRGSTSRMRTATATSSC